MYAVYRNRFKGNKNDSGIVHSLRRGWDKRDLTRSMSWGEYEARQKISQT